MSLLLPSDQATTLIFNCPSPTEYKKLIFDQEIYTYAKTHYGIDCLVDQIFTEITVNLEHRQSFDTATIDGILLRFGYRPLPMAKPAAKPFTVQVKIDLYYEVNPNDLPQFSTLSGVVKLMEEAHTDYNKSLTLKDLGAEGIWGLEPKEISVNYFAES